MRALRWAVSSLVIGLALWGLLVLWGGGASYRMWAVVWSVGLLLHGAGAGVRWLWTRSWL